ncbi:MAG: amidohydrolase [Deltaproteobacteria bacterium]|nr:amidohydrolase [Deltaproteobacteria bacterium]MBW2363317.1 amidohydrolase [Deltaproteobacteria bacterium]
MSAAATASMPIIDIDSHFTEPPDLWTSRAPARFKETAPRLVDDPETEGGQHWIVGDDVQLSPPGLCVIRPDNSKAYGIFTLTNMDEMTPAAVDVEARLRTLDEQGIAMQVVYPNVLGFAGATIMKIEDPELRLFCTTAYNDAAGELQQAGRGRLFSQALLPFWDIELAAKELERAHDKLGMTGFNMLDNPEEWGLPPLHDPYWDPIWSRAQERGMPCNFHIGSGGVDIGAVWPGVRPDHYLAALASTFFLHNGRTICNLIFSGLLDRFPEQKFVSVESGIGWIPFMLQASEYQMDESMPHGGGMQLRPTEYFRRQIYASFWFEKQSTAHSILEVGEDNVMFQTDFPHPTCLYGNIREHVDEALADLPEKAQRKVLYENAARVYQLSLPD